jgi:hypothetical protein
MRPGKKLGELLAEIRELQLADELKTPAEATAWVKRQSGEWKAASGN